MPTPERDDAPLVAGLDRVWRDLAAAAGDRESGLRYPVIASAAGCRADARTMVLRQADRESASLTFYSDSRAPKVPALRAAPMVTVVAYDAPTRLQLRLTGTAGIATAGIAVERAWAAIAATGRRAYTSTQPPGSPIPGPAAAHEPGDSGRANFAVITIALDRIEWLDLALPGHRRAVHSQRAGGWTSMWLVP